MARGVLKVLRLLTMPCRGMSELISKSVDTPLTVGERWALGIHLRTCSPCRRYRRHVKIIKTIIEGSSVDEMTVQEAIARSSLSPDAKRRMRERLQQDLSQG